MEINSLKDLQSVWVNDVDAHKKVHDYFTEKTDSVPEYKAHRDFVEQNAFGFGDRAFQYMWHIIASEMPNEFTFCEIGVFRGQILSFIRLTSEMQGKKVTRYGVTPLSPLEINWESDYEQDIKTLHDKFGIEKDYEILKGLSTDPEIIARAQALSFDILFIDGGHAYETALSDLVNYTPMLKSGGILVMDDGACAMQIAHGMFPGIIEVSQALHRFMKDNKSGFEFMGNVGHNMIYLKK